MPNFNIDDEVFAKYLAETFDEKDKGDPDQKKKLPSIFLKLDDLFKGEGPEEFKDCCSVYQYTEGLWMRHNGSGNPMSGRDSADVSWTQSRFILIIPKGAYHPKLRNYMAQMLNIKKGELIETARLSNNKVEVISTYTFPDCKVEGVFSDGSPKIKVILRCPVVKLETKGIAKDTLNTQGSIVSQINIPEHRVE